MKPIILVLGLSGVGKTFTAELIGRACSLKHFDMDDSRKGLRKSFDQYSFPTEWCDHGSQVDFRSLTSTFRGLLGAEDRGAVASFPTLCRFRHEQLRDASTQYGVGVVLLWGKLKHCWNVRRKRQKENKGTTPSYTDYRKKNKPTFEMYKGEEYNEFRVENLQRGGFRPPDILLERVLERLTKQGIDLTV